MKTRCANHMPPVSALVVGATDGDQSQLEKIFRECGWRFDRVGTRGEARAFMQTHSVRVVISERELPQDGWREVLEDLMNCPEPPLLVVTSRFADESLWAEVLNLGGYDVLAKPLDQEEVTRVIGAAQRQFDNERQRRQPASSAPMIMAAAS